MLERTFLCLSAIEMRLLLLEHVHVVAVLLCFNLQKYTQVSKRIPFESLKAFSLGMDEWMVSSDEGNEALDLKTEMNSECPMQADNEDFPSSPASQGKMCVAVSPLHVVQSQERVSPSPPPSPIIGGRRTPDLPSCSTIPPGPSRPWSAHSSSAGLQQLMKQASACGVRL